MRAYTSLVFLIIAGCASSSNAPAASNRDRILATDDRTGTTVRLNNDVDATRVTLPATADQVFAAVTSSYAFLKIPVTYIDRASGDHGMNQYRVLVLPDLGALDEETVRIVDASTSIALDLR